LVDERKRDVAPIDLLGCMAVNLTVADFLLLIVTYGVTVRLTMLEVTTGPDGFGSHGLERGTLFRESPHTMQRKYRGPLGPHIAAFAQQLSEQGYSRQCVCRRLQLIAELNQWLWHRDLTVRNLSVAKVERFLDIPPKIWQA
jgi:hypothetical protein